MTGSAELVDTADVVPGTLHDTARRVARALWFERRCFEVLGGWVPTTPEAEVKIAFARHSHHHAWHAELFERVLPVASGFRPGVAALEPGAEWHAVVDALRAVETTPDRLRAAYAMTLAAKAQEYEGWLAATDPVGDAPLRRWLGFVVADERADLEEGRRLLGDHPGGDGGLSALRDALGVAGRLLG